MRWCAPAAAGANPMITLAQEINPYTKIQPECRYFGTCGGCTLQDLSYPDQVRLKTERLRQLFAGIEGMEAISIRPADGPWRYRNKAEFTFGVSAGHMTLGFHAAGSFQRVVDLEDCLLLPESAMAMLRKLRDLAEATGLAVYHPKTHQGFFRYAVVRASHANERLLLCLVTASGPQEAGPQVEAIARQLVECHPLLVSVYWGKADQLADIALPEQLPCLIGDEYIEDQIGPFHIQLKPLSFTQTHSLQAHLLYEAVCSSMGEGTHEQTAWDLYCGVGLISLYLSRSFHTVYGIDSEPHHLHLAAENAKRNGLNNIRWITGKAEEVLKDRRFWLREAKPDVVVVDPPRTGLHIAAISAILAARPRRIAYVSCNPESLLRDLQIFKSSFPSYSVAHAEAFDMFPQTAHVETLAILSR